MKSGYSFEKASLMSLLRESNLTDEKVSATMPNLYICDLKIPRIALLGEKDKIIRIIDINDPISDEERQSITKYVILRDDCTKPEFAKYVEYLLVARTTTFSASSTQAPKNRTRYFLTRFRTTISLCRQLPLRSFSTCVQDTSRSAAFRTCVFTATILQRILTARCSATAEPAPAADLNQAL